MTIRFEHITFSSKGMEILIPRSKTDQAGEGQTCALPKGNEMLCPVTALKIWCEKTHIESGFIFRKISKNGTLNKDAIAGGHLNIILKDLAQCCNLSNAENYSSHSLRRGFATAASQQGASLSAIMRQGRWQHSDTALGYIAEAQRFEDNAADYLLKKRKQIFTENA